MRLRSGAVLSFSAAALLVAACGGNNNKSTPSSAPTRVATVAQPAASVGTPVARPAGATAAPSRPAGSGSPVAAATAAGDCLAFTLAPLDTASLATQPTRPAVKIEDLTVPQTIMPSGFNADDGGTFNPQERRTAKDLAAGTADPQAALDHLNQIGFLGGRQQGFGHVADAQGYIATITVQHFIFNSDAGATNFLHDPVIVSGVCVKQEPPPQIGQESNAFFYQAPVVGPSGQQFQGRGVLWRCGRILINVTAAGAPGQFPLATVTDLARKVQAQYLKTGQPCA